MNPKFHPAPDDDPFEGMKIGNWMILDDIDERSSCSMCGKSRKYFCYTCYIAVDELQSRIPKVKLPVKVDIIKHAREIDGKSTAAHAAILAPDDVKIYTYPDIPHYEEEEKVVLVYPGKAASTIEELFIQPRSANSNVLDDTKSTWSIKEGNLPVTRAVFIDSTWNQSRGIYKDPRLRALPCVILQSRLSQFWRHQKGSPRWYLATVEAIHQFLVELVTASSSSYDGEFDSLLFFFRYMYSKIHSLYPNRDLRAYKRPIK
ncbi:tRNA-uridine aminocarboxypropyltransferase 1 isoform X1 [Schistocerca piceifrons]|uniref:tRNA-uridine aminocarboxypropyltransferase 1 isoform X1 n=1 Tax=Schistocerca piceifrons TaxID=274613 RepID=UPI001F5FC9DD|nr:tRNA-uridine aminocarboxypropyltransferase 1 isoform X1 [Schistocerca piceifrons]